MSWVFADTRHRGLRKFVLGALVVVTVAVPLRAQQVVPTPQQIQIFQSLPPDQQQAILEQLQRGGGMSGLPGVPGMLGTQPTMQFPQTVMPRDVYGTMMTTPATLQPTGEPRIAAGDSIVIDIEVRTTARTLPPLPNPSNSIPGAAIPTSTTPAPATAPPATTPPSAPQTQTPPGQPIERSDEDTAKLDDYVDRVERGNPYRLDTMGRVQLPELPPIPCSDSRPKRQPSG
jgi:hypothetical protein